MFLEERLPHLPLVERERPVPLCIFLLRVSLDFPSMDGRVLLCGDTGQLLHELDHNGKVLIHPLCQGSARHLLGSRGGRHGHGQIIGLAQHQTKIFVHQREGKIGWILLSPLLQTPRALITCPPGRGTGRHLGDGTPSGGRVIARHSTVCTHLERIQQL